MKRRPPLRLNAYCVATMIRYMQDVPSSVHDLVEVSGLSEHTARGFVLALAKSGAIRTVDWGNRQARPVHHAGLCLRARQERSQAATVEVRGAARRPDQQKDES